MRKILIALCAGCLGLAACSEQTEQSAGEAARLAAADAAANAEVVLEKGSAALGSAADRIGGEVSRESAEVEAEVQNEPEQEARAD